MERTEPEANRSRTGAEPQGRTRMQAEACGPENTNLRSG
jgi:hypothetical protein